MHKTPSLIEKLFGLPKLKILFLKISMKVSFHTCNSFIKKLTIKYLIFKQIDGVTRILCQKLKLRTSYERVDGLGLRGRVGKCTSLREARGIQPKRLELPQRKHTDLVRSIDANNI